MVDWAGGGEDAVAADSGADGAGRGVVQGGRGGRGVEVAGGEGEQEGGVGAERGDGFGGGCFDGAGPLGGGVAARRDSAVESWEGVSFELDIDVTNIDPCSERP